MGRSRSWGGEGKEPGRMRTLMLGKIQKKKKRKVGNAKKRPNYDDRQDFLFPSGFREEDFRGNTVARRVGER